jgi:arylsulfatase A-like enzyme
VRRCALLAALLAAAGCGRPAQRPVVLDLAAVAPAADRDGPWQVVLFGSPSGIASQFAGFFDAALSGSGDTSAWTARNAEIGLRLPRVEPRAALLDIAPFPGVASQRVEVLLNDVRVGSLALAGQRRRYRLSLPTSAQRAGVNRVRLAFASVGESQKSYRRRMAAVLYGIAVAPAGDRSLPDLMSAKAPPPFSTEAGGVGLAVPGSVRFAFLAPEEGELRFTPALDPVAHAAGASVPLRVSLAEEGRAERTLWAGPVDARRAPAEVRVRLPAAPGSRVVLSLHHEGQVGTRLAWAQFRRPRLVARHASDPLASLPSPPPDDRPADALRASLAGANVVYVILDAASAARFGAYGHFRATTPHIDRIAREGVLFENAYSVATFTHLSMGSAWTSTLPDQHHNGVHPNAPLPRDRPTIAEVLSRHGIHTAGFVSNGVAGPGFALDRGFAQFDEVYRRLGSYAPAYRRVIPAWLEEHAARRFFLYLHYREPHFAYDPPPPFDTMFGPDAPLTREQRTKYDWITDLNWKRKLPSPAEFDHLGRLYDGNLAAVDHEIGELRGALEAAGLWDRSLVVITSDHGDGLYEHEYVGHLDQVYEEQVRVPLVVKFPRGGPAGVRIQGIVDTLDLAPTIADAFQLLDRDPAAEGFLGRSLLPVVLGAPGRHYSLSRCAGEQPKYGLRTGSVKLVYHTARDSAELYDLAADPGERHDLAPGRPVEAAYYRQSVRRLLLQMRRGPRASQAADAELSPDQRENLKALGYLP